MPNTQLQTDMRAARTKLSASRSKLARTTELDWTYYRTAASTLAGVLAALDAIERVVEP